ncbi:MAG: alpha-ketoacid dehydrogenase subunit beta, partial [Phototrophicales bacterium]
MKHCDALNEALHELLAEDPLALVIGEDIADPYGGAFKVTRGLSSRFEKRVISTPISEAAMMGVANGLAIKGMRPIVEIMFGDFSTLIIDQLLNHCLKFPWLNGQQKGLNVTLRLPMGGGRGYGATHSQSLEKYFFGMPLLSVVAPNSLSCAKTLLKNAYWHDTSVAFIEHKKLYPLQQGKLSDEYEDLFDWSHSDGKFVDTLITSVDSSGPKLTLLTYGYQLFMCLEVAKRLLFEYELDVEIVLVTHVNQLDWPFLQESIQRTGRLLVVEEGSAGFNWGSEVICHCVEEGFHFKSAPKRIGALAQPLAASRAL